MLKITPIIYYLLVFTLLLAPSFSCSKEEPKAANKPDPTEEEPPLPVAVESTKLVEPADDKMYHAAFPDFGGFEDEVFKEKIVNFKNLTEKGITWAYFSDNWFDGIHFPSNEVTIISAEGCVPFIRIMPRNENEDTPDPVYTMQAFIDGKFDNAITQWAINAKATGIPLLVEFGTEVNGSWFPWNAKWNGKSSTSGYGNVNAYDGTERFRDAYRHIIDLFNAQEVDNVTWFFHVNAYSYPNTGWNKMKDYYPGDNYIDWIGISVYGPQNNTNGWWSFEDVLNDTWSEISTISDEGKPIAVLEMGVIEDATLGDKAQWITDAYSSVNVNGTYYQKIDAMSYWHENFGDTDLRVDTSPETLAAYKAAISSSIFTVNPTFIKQ